MEIPRIYLTGAVTIEHGERLVRGRAFPGRQGRVAFAYLALHRHRPVARENLLAAIWPDNAPTRTDAALNAILSKLRGVLKSASLCADTARIEAGAGSVVLQLPGHAWVDLDAASNALDEAEGAMRRHDPGAAWSRANVAAAISRRPFLPDSEAPWIAAQRATLRGMQVRALQCLATISAGHGERALAIQHAAEIIALEPFRETAYQELMKLHASVGNRAEALRLFAKCRRLFRDELGVSPSPQTEAVYLEILRAE